ncbi:hypothetical protein GGS20DRAFT_575185 [Poronia punctata]|nr:hypothetical protein GGS20DRAFT_575185 [Poronia punctata]
MTIDMRKKPFDLIHRGEKNPTLSGQLTFIGLRLADIPLQRALLSASTSGPGVRLLTCLGLRTIFTHTSTSVPTSLLMPMSAQYSFWPANLNPTGLILLFMSAGSAAKQIYWLLFTSEESFPPKTACAVSFYNSAVNSLNSLLFLWLATTSLRSAPRLSFTAPSSLDPAAHTHFMLPLSTIVGTLCYIAGLTIEALAERQRSCFKARPENKGKVCKVGLWSWARHINYFGYSLWRGGYAMVASGWIGGLAMGLWQGYDLSQRAVNVLDGYCGNKYGEQWVKFKRDVPYRIIPGVY